MSERLVILPQPIPPVSENANRKGGGGKTPAVSFAEVLKDRIQPAERVKFSKHASDRMASRGINLNPEEMTRLNNAVNLAHEKGARDSLVLLGETALVVSVKNNTVITIVDKNHLNGNVFTNIDSAVIA